MVRLTLQGDLLELLGSRIVSGEYPPNHVLRTDDLEGEFDLSRTVVRETLKVLESMRLVALRRAVGITVLSPQEWNVFDPRVIRWRLAGPLREEQLRTLTGLRLAIEPVAARGAAANATLEQKAELLALAERMEAADANGDDFDVKEFLAADVAYHRLLLLASGNEMFAALADVITEVLNAYAAGNQEHPGAAGIDGPHLHVVAARAIDKGDLAVAETVLREILAEVNQLIGD